MSYANLIFRLNGKTIPPPLEWDGVRIKASFEGSVQASIETEQFTFLKREKAKHTETKRD